MRSNVLELLKQNLFVQMQSQKQTRQHNSPVHKQAETGMGADAKQIEQLKNIRRQINSQEEASLHEPSFIQGRVNAQKRGTSNKQRPKTGVVAPIKPYHSNERKPQKSLVSQSFQIGKDQLPKMSVNTGMLPPKSKQNNDITFYPSHHHTHQGDSLRQIHVAEEIIGPQQLKKTNHSRQDFKIRSSQAIQQRTHQLSNLNKSQSQQVLKDDSHDTINQKLLEFDKLAVVQDSFHLLSFGLRQKQYFTNRLHLKDFVVASKRLKSAFRKLLALYRQWKEKKELDALFRIVNDFDKVEGYDNWLACQAQTKVLDVVDEVSSDDPIEETKQSAVKPMRLKAVGQVLRFDQETASMIESKRRSVQKIEKFIIDRLVKQSAVKMRLECLKIPLPCRRSFVKMWHLKMVTQQFKHQVNKFARLN